MNTEYPNRMLPLEADDHLDRLLQSWADRHRVTPTRAETVRRVIVASSEELGYEWWQEWVGHMMAILTRATTVPKAVLIGLRIMDDVLSNAVPGWQTAQSPAPASYRSYLRLVHKHD